MNFTQPGCKNCYGVKIWNNNVIWIILINGIWYVVIHELAILKVSASRETFF